MSTLGEARACFGARPSTSSGQAPQHDARVLSVILRVGVLCLLLPLLGGRLFLPLFRDGHVMADDAAGNRAEHGMTVHEVTRHAADHGAFQAALGLGGSGPQRTRERYRGYKFLHGRLRATLTTWGRPARISSGGQPSCCMSPARSSRHQRSAILPLATRAIS